MAGVKVTTHQWMARGSPASLWAPHRNIARPGRHRLHVASRACSAVHNIMYDNSWTKACSRFENCVETIGTALIKLFH